MTVLLATPDFPPSAGGIQVLMEHLVRSSRRHRFSVITTGHVDARSFDLTLPAEVRRTSSRLSRQASLVALNLAIPAFAAQLRPAAIVCAHIVCAPGVLLARKALGTPVVTYAYAMEIATRPRLAALGLSRSDAVIAVSDYSRTVALAASARAEAISVVHPGVAAPLPPGDAKREPMILTIARLQNRYKGFDVMLRAMPLVIAQVPEALWVVVGDGSLRHELQATATAMGLDGRVQFEGPMSDRERDELLARARVFSMPSRVVPGGAGEGFGIVYLEAARFGVPSVAADEGGSVNAVANGITGTLVDPTDHVEVAAAITELLTDDAKWARYSQAARSHAEQMGWSKMAEEVEHVLDRVIAARPRGT